MVDGDMDSVFPFPFDIFLCHITSAFYLAATIFATASSAHLSWHLLELLLPSPPFVLVISLLFVCIFSPAHPFFFNVVRSFNRLFHSEEKGLSTTTKKNNKKREKGTEIKSSSTQPRDWTDSFPLDERMNGWREEVVRGEGTRCTLTRWMDGPGMRTRYCRFNWVRGRLI